MDLVGGLNCITAVREQPCALRLNQKGSGGAREAAQVKDIRAMQGETGVELGRLQEGAQTRKSLWKGWPHKKQGGGRSLLPQCNPLAPGHCSGQAAV